METPAFSSVPSHTEPCTAVWLHAFSPDNIITRLHMFLLTLWLMSLATPGHHQAPAWTLPCRAELHRTVQCTYGTQDKCPIFVWRARRILSRHNRVWWLASLGCGWKAAYVHKMIILHESIPSQGIRLNLTLARRIE